MATDAPLTREEKRTMNDRLKKIPVSVVRDMQAGIESLPSSTRERALYDWVLRTKTASWLH